MERTEIEAAIITGARRALRRAYKWSNDTNWPGDTGAENLLQVTIAEAIYQKGKPPPAVMLEMTLHWISREDVDGDARRVDISLHHPRKDGNAEACFSLVEVKKHPGPYDSDLSKFATLLDACPGIRQAYLVTYFQKQEHKRGKTKLLDDRIGEVEAEIDKRCGQIGSMKCFHLPPSRVGKIKHVEGNWHAAVLVSRFTR